MLARKQGIVIVVQCKFYSQAVGNNAVQQALAGKVYAGAHHAVVVTNATYTASARALAGRAGVYLLHHSDLSQADALFLTRKA